jgi:hypothetical protein
VARRSQSGLRNPDLAQRELNFAVQRTIDRIISALRDRGIGDLRTSDGVAERQRRASGLPDYSARLTTGITLACFISKEKDVEPPDDLTLNLAIDDSPQGYPQEPILLDTLRFSSPADILGQA